jgi:acetylornithine deacetylase/succinyl-diaminopimelate desuccinylase-like protein
LNKHTERLAGPGIGDNALGVAGLFGLLWGLRQRRLHLPGDVWLVANVGEEGLGDLRGMRAVIERFGDRPAAYLILEGMALGQVYHRGLGVQRYRITVRTAGGHSWVDFGRPSAVHELGELIHRLANLSLPSQPRTSLNIGVISGGTSINTIAAEASLELDLRSEKAQTLAALVAQVEELVSGARRPGVEVTAVLVGQRPPGEIPADHPLVRLAVRCLEGQGIRPCLNIGSTDANIPLSRGFSAICVGLTHGSGAHTLGEYIHTRPLKYGLAQLVDLAEQIYCPGGL